jgi:large subunit ribosomal protein L18
MNKVTSRLRRATKTRRKIRELGVARLSVHFSLQHIYAQVLTADGSKVLAVASTLDKEVIGALDKKSANKSAAAVVGKTIADRAIAAGITNVGFDRSGYKYHGRVKALAEAAREKGLIF